MDVSEAGAPAPFRTAGDDGAPADPRATTGTPTGPGPIRHRLVEVSALVEPLFDRWTVERGRPRTRTLRRLMQTVELMLRIDEELLLPAVGAVASAQGAVPGLAAGIERLRDTLGLLMRGATGRRDTPMNDVRRLHAAHRADVDAWLALAADGLPASQWATLAGAVDDRVAPWISALQVDVGDDDLRPPPPAAAPGSARSSPAGRGPAESPDASRGDGSRD